MITSIVIGLLSAAMFVYWFRYATVLVLESSYNEEMAQRLATQNDMAFSSIEESLAIARNGQEMDKVRDLLDRDLNVVLTLLAQCPAVREAGHSLECRILLLDYKLMKGWFAFTRTTKSPKAQSALREMAAIVGYMAAECGEQMSAS